MRLCLLSSKAVTPGLIFGVTFAIGILLLVGRLGLRSDRELAADAALFDRAERVGRLLERVGLECRFDLVRSLGADHVIAYDSEDPTATGHRYDAIIDIGGNTRLKSLRGALAPRGTLVIVGGEGGDALTGGLDRQLRGRLLSIFSSQTLTAILNRENHADLERLAALVDEGAVKPALEAHPLEQAPNALCAIEQGRVRGKLAIRP